MAQKQEIDVRIKAILDAGPSVAGLKELKKLQKEVGAGSSEFKKAQAGINDFNDSIKTAKGQSQDWIDTLGSLPGPLGGIGRGLDTFTSSTNKLGLAFKGLGIGLIVSAVGALTAAFSQNEKMTKKLEPLMIGFEKILGGIFAILEPVIDLFIDLAIQALPAVTKGIGVFYSALFGLYTFVKDVFVGVGKTLIGVFTLDLGLIREGWGQLTNSITTGVDAGLQAYDRFEEGSNQLTKTEKKNAEERNKAIESEAEKRKKVIDEINEYIAKGVEARGKTQQEELDSAKATYDSLMAKARKYGLDTVAITKSYNEQVAAINKTYEDKEKERLQKEFDDKLKKQQDANNLFLNQQKANLDQAKVLYGENSAEARKAQDEIFASQKKALDDEKTLLESKKTLTDAERNRLAQIAIDQQNLTTTIITENNKRVASDVETALKTAQAKKLEQDQIFADKMAAAEGDFQLQQQILDDKIAQDEAFYQKQLANEKLTAEQRKKLEEEYTKTKQANADAQAAIDQKKFDNQQKLLQATSQILKFAAQELGEQTFAGKALAAAASLIDTYGAITAVLKNAGKGPQGGIPGFAIAQAVATGLVGFKAVSNILKTPVPSPSGGGGASERPRGLALGGMVSGPGSGRSDLVPAMLSNGESVINAQSTAMFKPLLSSINAIGGGRRFADGGVALGSFSTDQAFSQLQTTLATQQAPIKTYVVSSDMTNQQMLDRNIKDRSTL
jgi:hypothetical protein